MNCKHQPTVDNDSNLKQNCNNKSILSIEIFGIKNNFKLKQTEHFNKNKNQPVGYS